MGYNGRGIRAEWKPCPTCGKSFKVHACSVARGGGKYCSLPCRPYRGSGNPRWRGGRVVDPDGRVLIYMPDHPQPSYNGTHVYEYRLVVERALGRFLRSDEIVHHRNGNVTDNDPANLEVMTQSEHLKRHWPAMMAARKEQHGF